jgi:uncharacterized protein YihD (DUF1040 family)
VLLSIIDVEFGKEKEKIENIIETLEKYWKNNHDLRLGQIISNAGIYNGYNDNP